ncbi:MAG: YigZ family protein [Sulfitobacter sp.]|nr:YigZ family protein [Sulfitobacter sp.]
MRKLGIVLSDRGSKYAVSGAPAADRAEVDAILKDLRRDKAYAKATHNTWGVLLPEGTPLKGDDGEAGAGMVILRMLERAELQGHLIVVTRWYGGKHLGGDRFRHVQSCVTAYLEALEA